MSNGVMELPEITPPFVSSAPPPECFSRRSGDESANQSGIINQGIDLNDVGDHGGNLGVLHGVDLNEGVNLLLHEGVGLNKEVAEGISGAKREMIDLNLDVDEECENVGGERKFRWFDLNLELTEDELRDLDDHEEELGGNGGINRQMGKELVLDNSGHLVNAYGDKGNVILDVENKEERHQENCSTGVDDGEAILPSALNNIVGGKREKVLDDKIELTMPNLIKLHAKSRSMNLKLESRKETPFGEASVSVGYDRGSECRKRRELRRSYCRSKRASFSGQDNALNGAGICNKVSSPEVSAVSEEMISLSGSATFKESVLSSKVELPPSSGSLDLGGASMFDFLYVYAFLRSFSTFLFLSPFELDDFVTSVKCNDSTLLFDSIHVSLLRTLRKHLESLSNEGSVSASDCLRSLNWDFLDLITWPVFVVEYLLLHSPGYIPGMDLCQFEPFQNDYYKMPASAKVGILQHLCDDVIEDGAFRSELNRRTVMTERPTLNMKSYKREQVAMDVANASSITEEAIDEPTDQNGDECRLCKMDGNLICCDGCPAAFHSRCVGIVSSQLPSGDWLCPECASDKDKTFKMGKSIRGAELLGTDPHGRHYYSSCDYLLVSESCDEKCSFRFYTRNDLPSLIEALESSRFLYDKIITAIRKRWNVIYGVQRMRNDKITLSYSVQSAFPESRLLSEKRSDLTTVSSNVEVETSGRVYVTVVTGEEGVKMENQIAGSEGSVEVSQAFTETNTFKEGKLDCSEKNTEVSDDTQILHDLDNDGDVKVEEGKNLHCGIVSSGTQYVNLYEFARMASIISEELTLKSSDKSCEDARRLVEKVIAGQLRVISSRFAEFSWSNIQNLHVHSRKEKCGWCFYCKVPEDGMDCLFIMNDRIPAEENFASEVLDMRSGENRASHLIDVICQVLCIENHLQGLLLGPWLNPQYTQLWRKNILEAADHATLKNMLLKLESSLHHLALSADWNKHVDSAGTMGSASHIVRRSTRVSSGVGISRKRKRSKQDINPSSTNATGLNLFWWRGGRASRKLFNWKVMPRALASKAGRQGGCRKILGVYYPDSGNNAKRMKCAAWRAAVETSKGVDQLALQVRELDANIRWNDIWNTNLLLKKEKESKKPIRSFKNVIIRGKCNEDEVVKYLLDFGRKRYIPDIVVKHGSVLKDSSSQQKKYWLEESHVPLHLLKAFEEKRIHRTSDKVICEELCESSRETRNLFKKKGFPYLFSRLERSGKYQCWHCHKDVLIRKAVSCQYCKGLFHKRHAWKSASSITGESIYTCHKCREGKFLQIDARKEQSELPKHEKPLEALKPCSGTGEFLVKEEHNMHSENGGTIPLVVPVRRSARNAERILKLFSHNMKVKKGKRVTANSSYWFNGLQLSRRTNDERVMHFRSKMLLVLSGEETTISDKPKCCLCGELEYSSELNYVACETCKVWFHGDALGLKADNLQNIIGFKCNKCLNKRPLVCPHQFPNANGS